jgi:hypothetical protein
LPDVSKDKLKALFLPLIVSGMPGLFVSQQMQNFYQVPSTHTLDLVQHRQVFMRWGRLAGSKVCNKCMVQDWIFPLISNQSSITSTPPQSSNSSTSSTETWRHHFTPSPPSAQQEEVGKQSRLKLKTEIKLNPMKEPLSLQNAFMLANNKNNMEVVIVLPYIWCIKCFSHKSPPFSLISVFTIRSIL